MAKGYKKVYYLTGGIPEWRSFNYTLTTSEEWQNIKIAKLSPYEFHKILKEDETIFLLDVRSLDRQTLNQTENLIFKFDNSLLAGNYIKNVRHCPLVFLEENYHLIPKDRKILVTDWIMKQSTIAAKYLTIKGYNVIGILKGGTARWQSEGFPLIQGTDTMQKRLSCE
ncbi:MAG: rhodanese-like domain-containing protein [Thermodesulfobacteriota bacterium]